MILKIVDGAISNQFAVKFHSLLYNFKWCEKISLSNKGKVSSNKGKKMSEEQKEKIRNSVKKNWELRKKVGEIDDLHWN